MFRKAMMAVPALFLGAAVVLPGVPQAEARSGIKTGMLRCNVKGNASFVFGSSRALFCVYTPLGSGKRQIYVGAIEKYGIDVGYVRDGTMMWAVVAPSKDVGPGALAGKYGGVSASVAAGLGVGANALLGGFRKSIALQPLSVSGLKGANIAAGITRLTLTATEE